MHQVIVDSLEEYMGGVLAPSSQRDFEAHLATCEECRREVNSMMEMSSLFESLQAPAEIEVSPGFYARVRSEISSKMTPSFWSLFSLDAAFGRRVVFASLLTLAVLG